MLLALRWAVSWAGRATVPSIEAAPEVVEGKAQAALLRDVVNPFHPAPLAPSCRTPDSCVTSRRA